MWSTLQLNNTFIAHSASCHLATADAAAAVLQCILMRNSISFLNLTLWWCVRNEIEVEATSKVQLIAVDDVRGRWYWWCWWWSAFFENNGSLKGLGLLTWKNDVKISSKISLKKVKCCKKRNRNKEFITRRSQTFTVHFIQTTRPNRNEKGELHRENAMKIPINKEWGRKFNYIDCGEKGEESVEAI
jgi:hypothetical protein